MGSTAGSTFRRLAAFVMAAVVAMSMGVLPAAGDAHVQQVTGVFDDGQEWQLSVPADWNGVVVNDLDAVGHVAGMTARASYFLDNGYAYTGTRRHPDRSFNWDPAAESDNMVRVLEEFEARFGEPQHTIQFGCSGGGSVGLSVAEEHPEHFDGVISLHASTPIELANMRLDISFALQALLDPDGDLPLIIEAGEQAEAEAAWLEVLEEAMGTDEGRARMALAGAVAQYPMWGSQYAPQAEQPDWDDPASVQDAMVRAVVDGARRAVTGRPMWDQPAGLVSWNVGVDYEAFYRNADPAQRKMVRQMYELAGLHGQRDLQADLDRINAQPRIEATTAGVEYFRERTHTGDIGTPVLHMSTIADGGTPAAVMAGYEAKIQREGSRPLYRQAFIDAAGHCAFNEAELAAAVETMMERIETGRWGNSTHPDVMNAVGEASGYGEPRFIRPGQNAGWRLPTTLNRTFFPDEEVPSS